PWDALARPGQTLAIYMGLGSLPMLCAKLIEHGLPADWPVALIEEGTSAKQRVLTGTLATLPAEVIVAGVKGASMVIVGEVVTLRDRLAWR
ncbi:MAG TPA: SAM-dependent methyltransferase, partial [Nevskia sp.]|nr:SAM-dependent methyltransferase [Nevskia sp.]